MQLAPAEANPPSGTGQGEEGFHHPFVPDFSAVGLAPEVGDDVAVLGRVEGFLEDEVGIRMMERHERIYGEGGRGRVEERGKGRRRGNGRRRKTHTSKGK